MEIFAENTTRRLTGSYTDYRYISKECKHYGDWRENPFFQASAWYDAKVSWYGCRLPRKERRCTLAQYETGSRKPKADLTAALAQVLGVSPQALDVPDIDSQIGLMHTLFTLEDVYGLTVSEADGEVCLKVNKDKGKEAYELLQMLHAWKEQADKLSAGEISKDDYDRWRYYYPKYDTTQLWAKVPSQELSNTLVEAFQDKLKKDE